MEQAAPVIPTTSSGWLIVPLLSHETIRQRRSRSLVLGDPQQHEISKPPDRPHFSRHDPRFLLLPPSAQIAGLYQGYGTVRLDPIYFDDSKLNLSHYHIFH